MGIHHIYHTSCIIYYIYYTSYITHHTSYIIYIYHISYITYHTSPPYTIPASRDNTGGPHVSYIISQHHTTPGGPDRHSIVLIYSWCACFANTSSWASQGP